MSARTFMATRAQPGGTRVSRRPSPWEARSRANSPAAARSARRCASLPGSDAEPMAPSVSAEARRALRGEGCPPFRVVRAVAELALVVALDIQLLRQRTAQPLVNGLLGSREPAGRRGGKLPRQILHPGNQVIGLDAKHKPHP